MKKDKSFDYFCQNMKYLRQKKSLSQKEMAKILNISVKTLAKIESGILPPRLNANIIGAIRVTFNVPPTVIFSSKFQEYYISEDH